MGLLIVLGWLFTALLLLLTVTCLLAGRDAIRLNPLFGIRLPALMRSETAWRAGHRAAILPAVIAFAVALLFSLIGLAAPFAYVGSIAAFVVGAAWAFARASRVAAGA